MQFSTRASVRAVLLATPALALFACGGVGGDAADAPAASAPVAAPAPPLANRPPTITGAAVTVAQVGEPYEFQPIVQDADGDAIGMTVGNLPPWATFDAATGRISGTPQPGDEGIYESISVTVADAQASAELAPFSIFVASGPTGTATLSWQIPPSKVDGTPLDDLAGFRILYGRDPSDLNQSVLIMDPTRTTFDFHALGTGIWYFAVVGVNAGGLEGPPSAPASKSI